MRSRRSRAMGASRNSPTWSGSLPMRAARPPRPAWPSWPSASRSIVPPSSAPSNVWSDSRRSTSTPRCRSGRRSPLWHDSLMRDVIVAGNWKMHTTPADAGDLALTIAARTRVAGVVRVICPPFVCLAAVRDALAESDPDVAIGAQNVHHELQGAYTGEISAPMLVGLADWVIVGHSERRRDAGETDGVIGRKLGRAVD